MDLDYEAMTALGDTRAITIELGLFEGFNFRQQSAILNLTARQVAEWNYDEAGKAEFWPSGDHAGVALVFCKQAVGAIVFFPVPRRRSCQLFRRQTRCRGGLFRTNVV